MSNTKTILTKSLKLQACLRDYNEGIDKQAILSRFERTWGGQIASHFLIKYDDAESLIWALDGDNLKLFIEKF